jgi:hypothetical protein
MRDKQMCARATCTCGALPGQEYCCDDCKLAAEREEAGEEPMAECSCHHADCGNVPEVPIETTGILAASELLAAA